MKYQKTDWKNTVYDDEGNVLQKGTPLVASNMEKIEDGIVKNENRLDEMGEVAKKNHTHQEFVDYENRFNTLEQGMDGLHTHSNKSILDKIAYSGAKQIIDLILLDELENHTHHANKITTNADYRFTNDTEKAKWNKASDDIGDITTLDTVDKSSLVGAMNELFTNVSDGKQLIATAITDKGVPTSSSNSFPLMANKIMNISTGKKFASGTADPLPNKNFIKLDNSGESLSSITVTGLDFRPSVIISIRVVSGRYVTMTTYINKSVSNVYPRLIAVSSYDTTVTTVKDIVWIKGDISPANVTYGGFTIPVKYRSTTPLEHWFAFE